MSLSTTTLSALQQAGAAVFAADAELKNAAQDYGQRVHAAMLSNPFGLGNDALFENWKLVARLSQTLAGIEQELQKVYQLATELTTEDTPAMNTMPTLAAPAVDLEVAARNDLAPTDVRVKSRRKTAKPAARTAKASQRPVVSVKAAKAPPAAKPVQAAKAAKTAKPVKAAKPAKPAAAAGAVASGEAPAGNSAKLLQHLERVLNTSGFTELNQTASAQATGIPLGSMTAAIKKLMAMGRIMAGPAGSYKLAA